MNKNQNDDHISNEEIKEFEENWTETVETFDALNLKKDLLRGIKSYGFEKPSPIQAKAILPIIKNRDTIVLAKPGMGKTGALVISSLQLIDQNIGKVQAVVLCPTSELAQQICKVYQMIGDEMKPKAFALTDIKSDIKNINDGIQMIIGTPCQVFDVLNKKTIKLDSLKIFCLDEVDEMISRGFLENIKQVFNLIPTTSQITLFTATMPNEIIKLTNQFMKTPAKVFIMNDQLTLEGIKQYYVPLKKEWKLEIALNIYKMVEVAQAIIYCNSKKTVEYITEEMTKSGCKVSSAHTNDREKVMRDFRTGITRVLVTTDLLDVYQASLIINYDLPLQKEAYLQRIGRKMFGKKATAINLVTPQDIEELESLQKFYNTSIEELPSDLTTII